MQHCRIACVKYLNTLPLIEGLDKLEGVELIPVAPSRIADMVRAGEADVGLVSLVDALSGEDLTLLPVGMIGCDGPTLTVRVFSSVPFEKVTEVHADTDSHTSVVLCRVVLEKMFGVRVSVVGFEAGSMNPPPAPPSGRGEEETRCGVVCHQDPHPGPLPEGEGGIKDPHPGPLPEGEGGRGPSPGPSLREGWPEAVRAGWPEAVRAGWPEAVLLIGDKVVAGAPPAERYPHQLDLGEAWKRLTGLPFVYAMWACRADREGDPAVRTAAAVLDRQRRHNRTRLDWIAAKHAAVHGWPVDLAREYVCSLLRFEVGEREWEAVRRFAEATGFEAASPDRQNAKLPEGAVGAPG